MPLRRDIFLQKVEPSEDGEPVGNEYEQRSHVGLLGGPTGPPRGFSRPRARPCTALPRRSTSLSLSCAELVMRSAMGGACGIGIRGDGKLSTTEAAVGMTARNGGEPLRGHAGAWGPRRTGSAREEKALKESKYL